MTKKTLKILLGSLIGVLSVGAICGILYGANSSVHNWVDNAINKIGKNVPEEYQDVAIESKLELTAAQLSAQGLQTVEEVDPQFSLKFALKNLPTDFDGDSKLVTKIVTGDTSNAYFKAGDNIAYDSITHNNGTEFKFNHKAFEKTNQSAKYLVKTYWAAYPDVFLNTEVTFKSDFTGTETARMQIVDAMALTTSFAEQQGVQIYSDAPATALISPKINNKRSNISANALIANKVVYGDASKITFANALGGSSTTIGMCHSNDILAVQHTKFTETGKTENYVIRSYLVEDESCYMDTTIVFKSNFTANSHKPAAGTLDLEREDDESMSTWEIESAGEEFETDLTFTSSVDAVSYLRISTDQGNPIPKLKIGARVFRNGIAEVEDDDVITVELDEIKANKTYNYYIDYVCIQDPTTITRIPVTVKGYVAPAQNNQQNNAPRMMMPKRAIITQNGAQRTTTLTATLLPENASDQHIDWFVTNADLTLSKTSSLSGEAITLSVAEPFLEEIHVTAKARINHDISSTCVIVYEA